MFDAKRVLILSPHTDDAELGCGGTIARLIEENIEVYVAVFSTVEDSVPKTLPPDTLEKEFLMSMPKLGVPNENLTIYHYPVRRLNYHRQEVLENIVSLRREIQPDLVLLPSGHDVHQDHQVVHIEGLRAFKDISVLGYELPWNHISFDAQAFVTLNESHLAKKWEALQSYESQLAMQRPYFSEAFLLGVARLRGVQVKVDFAEAYEVMRVKW